MPLLQVAACEHRAAVEAVLAVAGPLKWGCSDSQVLVQSWLLSGWLVGGLAGADFVTPLETALRTARPEVRCCVPSRPVHPLCLYTTEGPLRCWCEQRDRACHGSTNLFANGWLPLCRPLSHPLNTEPARLGAAWIQPVPLAVLGSKARPCRSFADAERPFRHGAGCG